jgi:hypothetical protein
MIATTSDSNALFSAFGFMPIVNCISRLYPEFLALDFYRTATHRLVRRSANYGAGSHIELAAMTRARHDHALELTLAK